MSAVYMLNSVGEMTPPCGTPVLNRGLDQGLEEWCGVTPV